MRHEKLRLLLYKLTANKSEMKSCRLAGTSHRLHLLLTTGQSARIPLVGVLHSSSVGFDSWTYWSKERKHFLIMRGLICRDPHSAPIYGRV